MCVTLLITLCYPVAYALCDYVKVCVIIRRTTVSYCTWYICVCNPFDYSLLPIWFINSLWNVMVCHKMHYKFIYIRLCTGQQLMSKEQFRTVHGVCVCATKLVILCVVVLTEEQLCNKQGRCMCDPADYFVMPSWLFLA